MNLSMKILITLLFVSYCTRLDKYIIIDGLHRASIYLNNNIGYIKCKIMKKDIYP